MTANSNKAKIQAAIAKLEQARSAGKLTQTAADHICLWLTDPGCAAYAPLVAEHVSYGMWAQLEAVFWTTIPFGTGGRRGRLYPIGTNAINDRTIGQSAQGLADYVKAQAPAGQALACAIAYDTRHRSREFAELCAEVMVAAGFQVFFLDGYRSTPELSFAVRHKRCSCGIIITASHNPPTDNAIKVYWSSGGQLLPPHDQGVIDRVMHVSRIERVAFDEGVASGRIVLCQEEVDKAFIEAVVAQSRPGPRDLKILYSPLHGVGASAVCPALSGAGFVDVEVFGPHAAPDPDFSNVPNHVANPENPRVFDAMVDRARRTGAELILATDPDGDRVGCAAPKSIQPGAPWATLTGNQIGALLADYLLETGKREGTLTPDHYVVKTLVTTELIRRIAEAYGVQTVGDLLVGFKYIGGVMEQRDPARFVLGAEESYGFLVGSHARDKDAAVASMLLAELAAQAKAQGRSLHERLDGLFRRYGCHLERQFTLDAPGAEGMQRMTALMAGLRQKPPSSLAGVKVAAVRDYLHNTVTYAGACTERLAGPTGDLVMLDLEARGNYVAVRPSGTEPKVKFYMFAYQPPEDIANLEATKSELHARLGAMERDLRALAGV